jgi:hypothetical protein
LSPRAVALIFSRLPIIRRGEPIVTSLEWLTVLLMLSLGGVGLWYAREQASMRTRKKFNQE